MTATEDWQRDPHENSGESSSGREACSPLTLERLLQPDGRRQKVGERPAQERNLADVVVHAPCRPAIGLEISDIASPQHTLGTIRCGHTDLALKNDDRFIPAEMPAERAC